MCLCVSKLLWLVVRVVVVVVAMVVVVYSDPNYTHNHTLLYDLNTYRGLLTKAIVLRKYTQL